MVSTSLEIVNMKAVNLKIGIAKDRLFGKVLAL